MRRTALFAAAIGGLFASSSFAAFTFNFAKTDTGATDSVLVRAYNDGIGGTGTNLVALNLNFRLNGSNRASFLVDDSDFDGTPDTVDIANGANNASFSFVRIGTAAGTFIVSADPSNATAQPNPYVGGVNNFSVTATTTQTVAANSTTNAANPGSVIARLIIPDGAGFTITGTVAGESGPSPVVVGAYNVVDVPEPTTLAAMSLAALGLVRRRK